MMPSQTQTTGQTLDFWVKLGAPSRIRTCAHGSGGGRPTVPLAGLTLRRLEAPPVHPRHVDAGGLNRSDIHRARRGLPTARTTATSRLVTSTRATNGDSAGLYDYVLRRPQRARYIRGDHSAGTAARPIAAIVTAVQLENR
jgi:hypothetical protein